MCKQLNIFRIEFLITCACLETDCQPLTSPDRVTTAPLLLRLKSAEFSAQLLLVMKLPLIDTLAFCCHGHYDTRFLPVTSAREEVVTESPVKVRQLSERDLCLAIDAFFSEQGR